MKRFFLLLFPLLAFSIPAVSQRGDASVTALKAARLFDGISDSPISNAVVIVEGNHIANVGSNLPVPAGARTIELGDATLLPGYIDCHTHLLMNLDPAVGDEEDAMLLEIVNMNTAARSLLGAKLAREDLQAGITSVRDVGNSGTNGDVALREAIEKGWVEGPRIAASTRALSAPGGQFGTLNRAAQEIVSEEYLEVHSPDEVRRGVQQAVSDGADLIKVIVNGHMTLSPDVMKALVEEAHRLHRKVAAHAIGDNATRLAAEAGVDSIEHAYIIPDDVLKTMATKHIFLVPTDSTADAYRELLSAERDADVRSRVEEILRTEIQHRQDRFKRAMALGVPIAAGSDMYYQLSKRTRGEASILMLQAYLNEGMSAIQVIKAATASAAELLGWQDRLGTIKKGNLADIIAVPGNPMVQPSQLLKVEFVMKGGHIFRNDQKN